MTPRSCFAVPGVRWSSAWAGAGTSSARWRAQSSPVYTTVQNPCSADSRGSAARSIRRRAPGGVDEIEGAEELAPGVLLAGPQTRVRDRDVYFAESRMAEFLGERTVLVDVHDGPEAIATGLARASSQLGCDLIVFIDVGGDVLAQGDEAGLRSPLCDALTLAAASLLHEAGNPVLGGIFGLGCDAELTPDEVLDRLARVAAAGGLLGARGLTEPIAERLEGAIELVPTEASALAVRAFRGESGTAMIRGGAREVQLTPMAALTFYFSIEVTITAAGRLARAVLGPVAWRRRTTPCTSSASPRNSTSSARQRAAGSDDGSRVLRARRRAGARTSVHAVAAAGAGRLRALGEGPARRAREMASGRRVLRRGGRGARGERGMGRPAHPDADQPLSPLR